MYTCLHQPPTWVIGFYLGSALDGTASNYWNTGSFVNRVATDRTIRVVIAEDYTLMAEGLRKLLECEFGSVTTVGNGRKLLDTVAASKPDVALVDIAMPLLNGIEATRQLGKISPATKVVIVTAHAEPQYVLEAFRAGASGFVLKRCALSELVIAIRQVLSGHTYVTPLIANQAVEAANKAATPRICSGSTTRIFIAIVSSSEQILIWSPIPVASTQTIVQQNC